MPSQTAEVNCALRPRSEKHICEPTAPCEACSEKTFGDTIAPCAPSLEKRIASQLRPARPRPKYLKEQSFALGESISADPAQQGDRRARPTSFPSLFSSMCSTLWISWGGSGRGLRHPDYHVRVPLPHPCSPPWAVRPGPSKSELKNRYLFGGPVGSQGDQKRV